MSHISRSNKPRRADRQVQAQVRKDLAAKRTPAEQLARLDAAHLTAKKERAKLKARLSPAGKQPETQPAAPGAAKSGKRARKGAAATNAS